MRALLSTSGSHADVELKVGLVAAQFDTVTAAAEERDRPFATGVRPTGGWR
jgi:hypothetical protein